MFAFEIDFYPTREALVLEGDKGFYENLEMLFASLLQNGNVIGEWQIVEFDGHIQARVMTPERESLQTKYFSEYSLKPIEYLNTICTQAMQMRLAGKLGNLGDCCTCENSSSYVLFTTYLDIGLPVQCCDCGSPVPFYKLPVLEPEKSYWQLYIWEKSYAHLDGVYMGSFVGERMAYHQLSNPRSKFMRNTREIANNLEKVSGKPVYVYLMHTYKKWDDNCPICGRVWRIENPEKDDYEYECEHCRLLSPEATAEAISLSELHP